MGRGRGKGGEDEMMAVGGTICCILVIVGSILLGISFSILEPNEMAIRYNANTQHIDKTKLWENGRHFLGVGNSFIIYSKTAQNIKGDIIARSRDGLALTLSIDFNYRFKPNILDLSALYLELGEEGAVKVAYRRTARNVLRDVSSKFDAFMYLKDNRQNISSSMRDELNTALGTLHGTVDSFQLGQIQLPPVFEAARTRQDTAVADKVRAQEEYALAQETQNGRVKAEQTAVQKIRDTAEATANKIRYDGEAEASNLKARLNAEMESFKLFSDALNLTTPELLTYVWMQSVIETPTKGLWNIGVPKSIDNFDNLV
jgi:regulator of protease activity HflC (stomatin/prohibitin superfamily)